MMITFIDLRGTPSLAQHCFQKGLKMNIPIVIEIELSKNLIDVLIPHCLT